MQNEEGLRIIEEEGNVVYKTKGRNAVCIGHIFHRNCLLEHCTEGTIEGEEDEKEDISSYWMTLGSEKILKLK